LFDTVDTCSVNYGHYRDGITGNIDTIYRGIRLNYHDTCPYAAYSIESD
jgi:hypothetical protein